MIQINEIFSDTPDTFAFWCANAKDTNDLAIISDNIVQEKVNLISVLPESVSDVWAYLEKTSTKIFARYSFNPVQKKLETMFNDLVANISWVCRNGANGVQIFTKMQKLEQVIGALSVVRDDLFFKHELSIGLDINDINLSDWDVLFHKLREIRANSLILTLKNDTGNKSDFVGRVYYMLSKVDFDGEIHFVLNNDFNRIEQVLRLVKSQRPELLEKLTFFLND